MDNMDFIYNLIQTEVEEKNNNIEVASMSGKVKTILVAKKHF